MLILQPEVKDASKKYKIALGVLAVVTVLAMVGTFIGVFKIHTTSIDNVIQVSTNGKVILELEMF